MKYSINNCLFYSVPTSQIYNVSYSVVSFCFDYEVITQVVKEFDVLPDKSCPDRNLEGYVLLPLKD